jgi:hypothetical protein
MLLTLPHHAKSKNSIPIKAKEVPDFFIRLLDIWDSYSVAPILAGESQISLKVANPGSLDSWVWGGIGIFFPHSQGLSKVRAVLASIFGKILCDEHNVIVPIVHTETEHASILDFVHRILTDMSKPFSWLESLEIPTILDISPFQWHGISNPSWRLSFVWACHRQNWPLSSKHIDEFKKLVELLGVKSQFDIQNFPQFYEKILDLPNSTLHGLKVMYPNLCEVLDIIVSDAPISVVQWGDLSKNLKKWIQVHFPWIDTDFCPPPRNLDQTLKILVEPQKLILLYLIQHPQCILKTIDVSNFFKKHGLILTIDQITSCLKSFEHTDSAGNSIKLQYKIKEKSRVWVLSRTATDGISFDLSINPFYV